jgi:hypothetical protein
VICFRAEVLFVEGTLANKPIVDFEFFGVDPGFSDVARTWAVRRRVRPKA